MRNPLRSRRSGRRKGMPALLIAFIMIVIPVLLVYYAFEHKLPLIGSEYTDYAIVPNSVNIRGGSPVRIAGVNVGEVTSVKPHGNATEVGFSLGSNARPIHTDATATIRDRLFLEGGYYLQINPGSPSAPVASEGYTIPEQNTASPVQFFQLLSTFDAAARSNLETLLNTANVAFSPSPGAPASDSGAGSLKQAIPQLTPDLKDAAQVSEALTGTHAGDVERLLSSTSDITTTLADHSYNLNTLIVDLDRALGALAGNDGALGASISGLDQTLKVTPATLTAVDRSLGPLDTLAANLTPSLRKSPPIVSQLTGEVTAVNGVVGPANRTKLVASLRTLLATFPTVLARLGKVFPPAQEVAACLANKVVPVLNETVQDGSLSTNDPVWKDVVHFLPNLAAASGNYDGNGPYMRLLVGGGNQTLPSTLLGSLPGVGPLVSSLLGGNTGGSGAAASSTGVSPKWVGDLTAADFRPDVDCTTQPVPTNLGADPAGADR